MYDSLFDPDDIPDNLRQHFIEVETVCGAPWVRQVSDNEIPEEAYLVRPKMQPGNNSKTSALRIPGARRHMIKQGETIGFIPSCKHDNQGTGKSIVLDPFCGSGTTIEVATNLGRDAIGLDLSFEYLKRDATNRMSKRVETHVKGILSQMSDKELEEAKEVIFNQLPMPI